MNIYLGGRQLVDRDRVNQLGLDVNSGPFARVIWGDGTGTSVNTSDGKFIVHKLPGNRRAPSITLKRATNTSKDLWDWHQKIYEGNVSDARKNGSVVLYTYDHSEVGRYNFMNAWPSKVSTGTLNAGSNDVLMEEVTIVCEELERVK